MNIRKHISIILSSLILFANIGLAFNVHYCHGAVSSVVLSYKAEHCATPEKKVVQSCCAKAAKSKGCCKSHVVKLHDKSDKTLVKSLQLNLNAFCTVAEWKPLATVAPKVSLAKKDTPYFYCDSNAPPLYKLHCQLVLYA